MRFIDDDAALFTPQPLGEFEPAEFLVHAKANVAVRPDADLPARGADGRNIRKTIGKISFRDRAQADAPATRNEFSQIIWRAVRAVDRRDAMVDFDLIEQH